MNEEASMLVTTPVGDMLVDLGSAQEIRRDHIALTAMWDFGTIDGRRACCLNVKHRGKGMKLTIMLDPVHCAHVPNPELLDLLRSELACGYGSMVAILNDLLEQHG